VIITSRLSAYNHGQSPHTSKYKPWILITYLAFNDKARAISFEKYLKSNSEKAFKTKGFGNILICGCSKVCQLCVSPQ
jgi:predicted GIY-YIG superfamily endonuclease